MINIKKYILKLFPNLVSNRKQEPLVLIDKTEWRPIDVIVPALTKMRDHNVPSFEIWEENINEFLSAAKASSWRVPRSTEALNQIITWAKSVPPDTPIEVQVGDGKGLISGIVRAFDNRIRIELK